MSAHRDVLMERWRAALVFRFQNDSADEEAIPDGRGFPRAFLTENTSAPWLLGGVLGIALLKLVRPFADGFNFGVDRSGYGLISAVTRHYGHDDTKDGAIAALDLVINLALCLPPNRLEALRRRIDAVTNAALHEWAMLAVQGIEPPDMFAGLLDD